MLSFNQFRMDFFLHLLLSGVKNEIQLLSCQFASILSRSLQVHNYLKFLRKSLLFTLYFYEAILSKGTTDWKYFGEADGGILQFLS